MATPITKKELAKVDILMKLNLLTLEQLEKLMEYAIVLKTEQDGQTKENRD